MLLVDVLRHIHERGHIPEYRLFGPAFLAWAAKDGGREVIARFQRFWRLPDSGVFDAATEAALTAPRCGLPDIMAARGQQSGWGITRLTYHQGITYAGVSPEEVAADYALAVNRVIAVCGLQVAVAAIPSAAQIVARSAPIDGPWNVLALSELPPPNNVKLALNQTFDVAETGLSKIQRQAMMAHEFCHCLGLGHAQPGSGNLMEPVISNIVSPQAWDTAELLARYPITNGAPPPDPGPGPPAPDNPMGVPVSGNGWVITTTVPGGRYTVPLGAAGQYMILVVPLPPG